MTDIMKVDACSGQTWEENLTVRDFQISSQYIAPRFFQRDDFTISSARHVDGINERPTFIPSSCRQYHGSGSMIINSPEIGEFAIWVNLEYDPNPLGSHLNGNIHLDLYLYSSRPGGSPRRIRLPRRVHAVNGRRARVRLTDLFNKEEVFSEHPIEFEESD